MTVIVHVSDEAEALVVAVKVTEPPAVTDDALRATVIPVQIPVVLVVKFTISAIPPVGTTVETVDVPLAL